MNFKRKLIRLQQIQEQVQIAGEEITDGLMRNLKRPKNSSDKSTEADLKTQMTFE